VIRESFNTDWAAGPGLAPRGLAAGVVRARALLIAGALAIGVLGSELSPTLAVALLAVAVAALVASGR